MENLNDYIIALTEQIDKPISHPKYPTPVILRVTIDAITKLPHFYFEEESQEETGEAQEPEETQTAGADELSDEQYTDYYTEYYSSDEEIAKPEMVGKQKVLPKHKKIESATETTPAEKKFIKYNDAWLYKTNTGIYVKFTSDKYKNTSDENLNLHVNKMLINTFGDNYENNPKYIAMQERYANYFNKEN